MVKSSDWLRELQDRFLPFSWRELPFRTGVGSFGAPSFAIPLKDYRFPNLSTSLPGVMAAETNVQQTNRKMDTSHSVGVNVTTKSEPTGIGEGLELNPWYFVTVPGILKLVQLVFAIICMGCASPVLINYAHFFMFVVATYFIITFLLCIAYFFTFKTLIPKIPWLLTELIITAVGVVLYFIAMVVQLAMTTKLESRYGIFSYHGYYGPYIAAGVFALFNTIAYAIGTFFLFLEWKESKQGTSPSPN